MPDEAVLEFLEELKAQVRRRVMELMANADAKLDENGEHFVKFLAADIGDTPLGVVVCGGRL